MGGSGGQSFSSCISRCGVFSGLILRLMFGRPSAFVLSEEGKQTQERLFEEVMEELEKVVPGIGNHI